MAQDTKLSSGELGCIFENLLVLWRKMPSEFAHQFLLYTGPIVLKGAVSHKLLYQHFLALSIATSTMLDSNRRDSCLGYSWKLIQFFSKKLYCAICDETFAVYHVRALLHLHMYVRHFQCSLNELSCFKFENFLQKLKKLVRYGQNPLVQVAKPLGEVNTSNPKSVYKII